jgi:signal transduction histidine kinase
VAEEFEKQNLIELNNSDVLSIANRLNSMLTALPWVCIEARRNNITFYSRDLGTCVTNLWKQSASVYSTSNEEIEIFFVLSFPNDLRNNAIIFIFIETIMLLMIVLSQKKIDRILYQNQLKIASLAEQVAHDIRSPLSALEMLSSILNELPEDKRTILRNSINRIRDITNSLLQKRSLRDGEQDQVFNNDSAEKSSHSSKGSVLKNLETELLMPIVDSLITEKRTQYREKLNLQIDFVQTKESYGLFSQLQLTQFKRVLSNLIDNAVEALPDFSGRVNVALSFDTDFNTVTIEDNGCGIQKETLKKIGERGATFNKESGSGLGLFYAKTNVADWGGNVQIESDVGIGTKIRIHLPREMPPPWFVSNLILQHDSKVIIFDDDQSVHQIWKERIDSINSTVQMIHITTPMELRKLYGKNFSELDNAIFLMDYEILNSQVTGLELIEELNIQLQSILVTSRYDEPRIRDVCDRLKVKLIPKSMSGFVPIDIV